jgi:hypothetical protein
MLEKISWVLKINGLMNTGFGISHWSEMPKRRQNIKPFSNNKWNPLLTCLPNSYLFTR